jgi:hypothetical protein
VTKAKLGEEGISERQKEKHEAKLEGQEKALAAEEASEALFGIWGVTLYDAGKRLRSSKRKRLMKYVNL